jgi:4-amino-4-deoxy-L-arabinose transferase-like glycosyltransferase
VDEKMGDTDVSASDGDFLVGRHWVVIAVVLAVAAIIYMGCSVSPPSLMDDVDGVHGAIPRNMLTSGDWVTARIDGVAYLEKAPLIYWAIAISYTIFGVHDWSARIPVVLACIGLAWLTVSFGIWAFGRRAGLYAGLCIATCLGLFLFTRILLPDVILTLVMTLTLWSVLRALDVDEPRPRWWAFIGAASMGVGLLLKSLIAMVFPLAGITIYLLLTQQFFKAETWKRLRPISGLAIILLIAAPWHILAALRNPPMWAWTLHSGPGQYHGFTWFYFINEQLLRFLNLRYPRDYNTVPRVYFWLFHFAWLFPWSVYFPAVAKLSFRPVDRAGRTRLLALCFAGFLLAFFTFSTTQEYYSMPCYATLALLLGSAMATDDPWVRRGTRVLSVVAACAAIAAFTILLLDRNVATPGDISNALSRNPAVYSLSLGHMEDLTLPSFAYLRFPLAMAGVAFLIGAAGTLRWNGLRAVLATTLMMVIFFHAARIAMVTFDPYLSSRPIAEKIKVSPPGRLITNRHYYPFSSIFFYLNCDGLLLNGKRMNLEYGAFAPGAPDVFIDDAKFAELWQSRQRYYFVADGSTLGHFEELLGREHISLVMISGGKILLTNLPFDGTELPPTVAPPPAVAARPVALHNRHDLSRSAGHLATD